MAVDSFDIRKENELLRERFVRMLQGGYLSAHDRYGNIIITRIPLSQEQAVEIASRISITF